LRSRGVPVTSHPTASPRRKVSMARFSASGSSAVGIGDCATPLPIPVPEGCASRHLAARANFSAQPWLLRVQTWLSCILEQAPIAFGFGRYSFPAHSPGDLAGLTTSGLNGSRPC
jgi:hypothetical protein